MAKNFEKKNNKKGSDSTKKEGNLVAFVAEAKLVEIKSSLMFALYSGATEHMCRDLSFFSYFKEWETPSEISSVLPMKKEQVSAK